MQCVNSSQSPYHSYFQTFFTEFTTISKGDQLTKILEAFKFLKESLNIENPENPQFESTLAEKRIDSLSCPSLKKYAWHLYDNLLKRIDLAKQRILNKTAEKEVLDQDTIQILEDFLYSEKILDVIAITDVSIKISQDPTFTLTEGLNSKNDPANKGCPAYMHHHVDTMIEELDSEHTSYCFLSKIYNYQPEKSPVSLR